MNFVIWMKEYKAIHVRKATLLEFYGLFQIFHLVLPLIQHFSSPPKHVPHCQDDLKLSVSFFNDWHLPLEELPTTADPVSLANGDWQSWCKRCLAC